MNSVMIKMLLMMIILITFVNFLVIPIAKYVSMDFVFNATLDGC